MSSWLLGRDEAFAKAAEGIAAVGGYWGLAVREAFYRATLARVGRDVHIGYGTVFSKRDAWIGDEVFFGRYCTIGRAVIRRRTLIADHVQILSGRHHHMLPSDALLTLKLKLKQKRDNSPSPITVTIGEQTWIGGGAVIMADIGDRAVIAAGAAVVKPVDRETSVGGVPAQLLPKAQREAA